MVPIDTNLDINIYENKPFLYKINPTKPVLRGADLICNKT